MENSKFIDKENIPQVSHYDEDRDKDYDNYNTPNISKIDDTTLTTPGSSDKQVTSTL